ncbi:MAG: DHH family phosphoesterase [Candidatus Bathyarchaeia archaeon]
MEAENGKVESFLKDVRVASEVISRHVEKRSHIRVITHFDADGLSAGGLIAASLMRMGGIFSVRAERWIDANVINETLEVKPSLTIFIDFGSGYLDLIRRLKDVEVVVLDHHQPSGESPENVIEVNPHVNGIDGAREVSGAGVAYLTAKALSDTNIDLAYLGVVGALADQQDKFPDRSLGGVNGLIVNDAIASGTLEVDTDLLLFGRETRPIHKALASTTEPFIPGISGEEDKSLALLKNLGIKPKEGDRWRALRDLSKDEKKLLFSELASILVAENQRDAAMSLIGTVYTLRKEEPWTSLRDCRELASLLNATGRMGRPGLGIAICAGDRGTSLKEAEELLQNYRRAITQYMRWVSEDPTRLQETESFFILHGGEFINERLIGTISNIAIHSLPRSDKPLIAYSLVKGENIVKISARGTDETVKRGINLGEIMKRVAERFSGLGGGHDIAAGGQVPMENLEGFINALKRDMLSEVE